MPLFDGIPARRARDGHYDLLMAIDHLMEGAQLYSKASQDALDRSDSVMADYFANLERMSREQAEMARRQLEPLSAPLTFRPARAELDEVR